MNAQAPFSFDCVALRRSGRTVCDRDTSALLRLRARVAHELAPPHGLGLQEREVNGTALELALKLEDVIGTFCVGLAQSPYHVHRYLER